MNNYNYKDINKMKDFLIEDQAEFKEISCCDGLRIDIEKMNNTEKFRKVLKNTNLKYRYELGTIVITD